MAEFIQANIFLLACSSAGLCIFFATYVIVDFIAFAGNNYKERFIQEAAVEMEDVLLQIPPSRVLDVSLAVSALAGFFSVGLLCLLTNPTVVKVVFVGLVCMIVAFPMPRLYLRLLRKQRLQKFTDQLEDALLAMSSSLKAGFSINQALDAVAQENRSPISFEFTLLMQELRLGVSLEDALLKMNKRLGSPDFELVSVAIITARQTGGELTAILERLAGVIRERVKIQQKIRSLTAQGRLQAYIIGAVPFLLMLAMFYISPDMMDSFFSSITGILLLAVVIALDAVGFFVIRKITTIDI